MEREAIEKFKDDVKKNYLVISRVPPQIRQEFIEFSNIDFCGDYGMALKNIWDQFKEYQFMKQTIFGDINIKLDNIKSLIENKETSKEKKVKLMSGKELVKGGLNE